MPRLAAAFALAAAGCAKLGAAQETPLGAAGAFERFVKDFERVYDEAEKEVRYAAFVANYALVQAENAKGHSYKLGINEFADMTQEEFAMTRLGLRPSERKPWGKLPHLGTHARTNTELPESVDWRDKGAVQKVKNQASCGSCWAFSSTAAMEGAWQVATGKLVSLSEQQLVDCSKKQGNMGCHGGMMDNAFEYEEGAAVCSEESYPYKGKSGICSATTCEPAIPKGGVVGFKDVATDDEEALMDAIAQQPVSVAIEADQMVFQLYKGGVLDGKCGTNLDHGVVAVGYGVEDGKKYWLIRNSWGPTWGEDGYIKLLRGNKTLSKAGECGILTQPSYPVVNGKAPPAPPSPSPSPTPPGPSPADSHYEQPPCQDDEVEARVQGSDGSLCAPQCDDGDCPSDVPKGTTATPMCILKDTSGDKFCALTCSKDSECPSGGSCASQGALGICVYASSGSDAVRPKKALSFIEDTPVTEVVV